MEDWEGEVVEMKGWLRLALVNLCMEVVTGGEGVVRKELRDGIVAVGASSMDVGKEGVVFQPGWWEWEVWGLGWLEEDFEALSVFFFSFR